MLSICIPAYTYVKYTGAAVRDILSQNTDVELVIVEDFDLLPEGHPERDQITQVRDLLASDPRIKWVSSNTRRPIQENWNQTVALASRPYVKVMGADDSLRPHALDAIEQLLRSEPDPQFIGHLGVITNEQGQVVRRMRPYVLDRSLIRLHPDQAVRLKLQQMARFREPACNIFSKAVWQKVGGYQDTFRFCFDVHFNLRVMAAVPSMLVSEEWCELRRHDGSDGAQLPAELALRDLEGFIAQALGLLPDGPGKGDIHNAQTMLSYRVIELALARAKGSPLKALQFIWQQRERLSLHPQVLLQVLGTLRRRLQFGDVQNTLPNARAFDMAAKKQ
jgi:Glycosyl transferase family 2